VAGDKRHASAALPPGKTLNPLYRRLGGQWGRSGRGRKTSPPPIFDPQTVQPAASRYTDCAIPTKYLFQCFVKLHCLYRGRTVPDGYKRVPVHTTGVNIAHNFIPLDGLCACFTAHFTGKRVSFYIGHLNFNMRTGITGLRRRRRKW
jgi:hypothetical protein